MILCKALKSQSSNSNYSSSKAKCKLSNHPCPKRQFSLSIRSTLETTRDITNQ